MRDTGGGESYCPSCGESLQPSDYFCPQCGTENEAAAGPPPDVAGERSRRRDEPRENGGWAGRDGRGTPPESGGRQQQRRRQRRQPRERAPPQAREADSRAPPGLPGTSRDSEPGWRPIGVGIGLAGLSILLLILFTVLSFPLVGILGLSSGAALIIGAAAGQYFGFFGLALAYLRYTREFEWKDVKNYLGLRVPTLKELGIVVLGWVTILGLAILVGTIIQFLPIESADNESANQLAESAGTDPLLIFGVFALMFLVVGPCEEILYRGVIQNRIRERFSRVPAIIAASVIFASVHFIALGASDPVAILTTISILSITALVLGGVYEYTGNLVVPWLLHSIHNSIIFVAVFFGPSAAEGSLVLPAILALLPI